MRSILYFIMILGSFLYLTISESIAAIKCLDANGEAAIVNNDIPSAKAEAITRAKWSAVEQAVGVEVKAQSIVQNTMMVDEAISKKVNGIVSKYKVLQVDNSQDIVNVKINACVEPTKAQDALAGLALNNSIAVFIPAKKPKVVRETQEINTTRNGKSEKHNLTTRDEHEEANILSETIIGNLTEQGYTVVDVAPTNAMDSAEIEKAMKSGNFMSLRSLMYKFLSNVILIGKIDYTISTRKGEDIGYGIAMPFNNVTVRLTYRLITKDSSGKMIILTAGTEQGKGLANNVEDATAEGLKDLSEKLSPVILDKVGKYIQGVAKKIEVKVNGVTEVSDNFAVKEVFQNIAWVSNVEERGLGVFTISYPENPIYLANSIKQKGNFKLESFTSNSITVRYSR
ncbi:MAG: hypothetical protein WC156_14280 [Pedobacter sp.]